MKLVAVIAIVGIAAVTSAQPAPQTVVFVCEHGAAKSVVAAAHFNKVAAERGLPFRAVSRGTAPDPTVPPAISTGLKSEGLSVPAGFRPSLVAQADVATAARIVTFDVSLPVASGSTQVTRWDKLPAFSDGYGPASAAIAARVDALLGELARTAKRQ